MNTFRCLLNCAVVLVLTCLPLLTSMSRTYADSASDDHALLMRLATRLTADEAQITSLKAQLASKQSGVALNTSYGPFTVNGKDVYLTGYNLYIQSGSGSTGATPNGLGNLIIGYDETRGSNQDVRTGSHNLILGTDNNYSSYGGIVGGFYNNANGPEASILGGFENSVTGRSAVVLSGVGNSAGAHYTAVAGGQNNSAAADDSVVGGGKGNAASVADAFLPVDTEVASINSQLATLSSAQSTQGSSLASLQSTIAGSTKITNLFSLGNGVGTNTELTLSGVNLHVVNGMGATDGNPSDPLDNNNDAKENGLGNLIIGYDESRSLIGQSDSRNGSHNLIVGSLNNYTSFGGTVVGVFNETDGAWSSVSGGNTNTAKGVESSISGGSGNTASGEYASVSGGASNIASGKAASIVGSDSITASNTNECEPVGSTTTEVTTLQTAVTQQGAITSLFKLANGVGTNTELTLSGVNLHIVNGLGATDGNPSDPKDTNNDAAVNGLGNLIIGYNELRGSNTDVRTGSHNLIIGSYDNYSQFGGIVAGYANETDGEWSCVAGGSGNFATGTFASALGGQENRAEGLGAAVGGGVLNIASGTDSSVSAGDSSVASGFGSSISGGFLNAASADASSVSGGQQNKASGNESSISGGFINTAAGAVASVSGGYKNSASGLGAAVTGGVSNTASGTNYGSAVSGGYDLNADGGYLVTGAWDGNGPSWLATTFSGH